MTADDLAKILDQLGQRLGPAGQHVYELAIRQVYINAVTGLIVGLAAGYAAYRTWGKVRAIRKQQWAEWNAKPADQRPYPYNDGQPDDSMGKGIYLLLYCIPATLVVASTFLVAWAVSGLANPEYAALSDLLSKITGH